MAVFYKSNSSFRPSYARRTFRQRRIGRRMRQIVRNVGEERAFRFQLLHDLQRVLHAWNASDAADAASASRKRISSPCSFSIDSSGIELKSVRYAAVAESIGFDRHVAMQHGHGCKRSSKKFDGAVHRMQLNLR